MVDPIYKQRRAHEHEHEHKHNAVFRIWRNCLRAGLGWSWSAAGSAPLLETHTASLALASLASGAIPPRVCVHPGVRVSSQSSPIGARGSNVNSGLRATLTLASRSASRASLGGGLQDASAGDALGQALAAQLVHVFLFSFSANEG